VPQEKKAAGEPTPAANKPTNRESMDDLLVDGGALLNGEHLLFVREVRVSLS